MHEGCQDPVADLVLNLMTMPSNREIRHRFLGGLC